MRVVDVNDALRRQPDVAYPVRAPQPSKAVPRVHVRRRAHVLHHLRGLADAVYLDLRHVVQRPRKLPHVSLVVQEDPDEVAPRVQRNDYRAQARHRVLHPRRRILRGRAVRPQAHDQVRLGALARHGEPGRVPPAVGQRVQHSHQVTPDGRGPPRRGPLMEYPADAAHISPLPIVPHRLFPLRGKIEMGARRPPHASSTLACSSAGGLTRLSGIRPRKTLTTSPRRPLLQLQHGLLREERRVGA